MCLLEEVYIIVGRVPGLEGYNSSPFVLWKSNMIEEMYPFEEVNEVPPKFNFSLFNEEKKWLARHSKKETMEAPQNRRFYFEVKSSSPLAHLFIYEAR